MALVLADRVNEVSTTTGTGDFILAGAVTSFQSFNSAIGVGNTTYYTIECIPTGQWETGLGTLLDATTLQRTTVYASSSAGSLVNFSAETKNVFVDLSATKWTSGNLVVGNGGTGSSTAQGASESLSTTYTVDNLASLKALTTRPSSVFMKGYSTPNDGGEGIWEWVAGSTATANDGTIVQCTSGTAGRYFRVVSDTIRPEWFGAKGDGVTIDTSAFNSAIAACNNQSLLLDPAKVGYPIAVTIGSTSGCTGMISNGGRARIVRPSTATISTTIIYCQRGDFEIENLFFDLPISTDPAVSPLVSYAFRFDLSGSAGRIVFNNNWVRGGRGCVTSFGTGAAETYITNNLLEQFWVEALTLTINQNVYITGNTIQDGGYSTPPGSGAIRISAPSGILAENIIIADNIIKNCMVSSVENSIDCFMPSGGRNISITGNIFDLNGGGIELKTEDLVPAGNVYKNILLADNIIRLLNTPGINQIGIALNLSLTTTPDGKAADILISGNKIVMDAPPASTESFSGIIASCYDNVTIVGNSITNTVHGIQIAPINTISTTMRDMSIVGNIVKVTGSGIYCQNLGTLENLRVTDNNVDAGTAFFFTSATTNNAYIANNFGKSSGAYAALGLTNCVGGLITRNTFECDAAYYGIYVYGSGTSGVIVSNNNITTNATTGWEAVRVNAGNSITLLSNQISVPDSRAAYTGAGTITAANNVRGTKTTTPTTAGSIGDVWLNSTPASGSAMSWVCTTSGGSGVAVYTPSILGTPSLAVGSTIVSGGTSGNVLYNNAGSLGEMTTTGTGTKLALSTSPALVTPDVGVATGTSLALGGATIGSNALAVTGTSFLNGNIGIGSASNTTSNLYISKNVTGGTSAYSLRQPVSIQSDVTSSASINYSQPSTQATAFTLSNLNHYFVLDVAPGAGSTVTNQYGFRVNTLVGATYNYGFYGSVAAAPNSYNLCMAGTANNYLAGSLGIGTPSLTAVSLRTQKNITGSTGAYNILTQGAIQSDVTSTYYGITSQPTTAAASFTLSNLIHYIAIFNAASKGAGSTVTTQYGYYIGSGSFDGATNNYAFYSNVASASGTYNIYMAGTAANYFNGTVEFNAAIKYGGVTLTNGVTGTGSMVLSAAPTFTSYIKTTATTVSGLPSASTAGAGARSFVTDANATTFASIVAGGGSDGVPVYSDGTNWRIG